MKILAGDFKEGETAVIDVGPRGEIVFKEK